MNESYKINIINNKHLFEVLETKSQIVIFSEIFKYSIDNLYVNNSKNRNYILNSLSEKGKVINEARFMSILKDIVDKGIMERVKKGVYLINDEYINKI